MRNASARPVETDRSALSTATLPCVPEAVDDFLAAPSADVVDVLKTVTGPVVILGAGGKMGLHLCVMIRRAFDLLGRRDRVIAVSRFASLRDESAFQSRGIEVIACDLSERGVVSRLPRAENAFFLAGVKFGTAGAPELLQRMNVVVPELVAEHYAGSRLVVFSTGCVYPFVRPETGGATEATPPSPPGDYARSCLAREKAFSAASQRHGMPVVLVRLNYAVEFRYGVLLDIALKVYAGEPVDVSTGYVNVIWQRDAVAQIIQSLEVARSPAVPINITGPDVLSVRELARAFGRLFGREPILRGTEAETAWLNNAARSHRLFGQPATSPQTMIEWIAAWVQRAGETWSKPTGFEKRDGKF